VLADALGDFTATTKFTTGLLAAMNVDVRRKLITSKTAGNNYSSVPTTVRSVTSTSHEDRVPWCVVQPRSARTANTTGLSVCLSAEITQPMSSLVGFRKSQAARARLRTILEANTYINRGRTITTRLRSERVCHEIYRLELSNVCTHVCVLMVDKITSLQTDIIW